MNEILLTSKAEIEAEKAESLKAFSGLKLLHVKQKVASILAQIGRDGIFDEYTKHDISHIDYMLESLEWIIPVDTQNQLTPANWLMITLSIYFHDLGMLVTKDEFKNREKSAFPSFKHDVIEGKYGLDYKDKVLGLGNLESQDRFLYQELVRKTHAERIKSWILEEPNHKFANNLTIVNEIKKLISNLDSLFKRDLAIICESHHLSDLDDFEKYKPNQQYGTSKEAYVNLHYTALILRTADLLHITSDRTPSIEFSLINPTDPISQDEWAKQSAVKAIRPQNKKNSEGFIDEKIPKDTLEIIAYFEDEKGFFGLISYINYANKQLKESHKNNEFAKKTHGTLFDFPWKNIDDSNIQAKDFEKRQFEFVIDQTRILDLLVGHTLYNDSTVVLRELTQNAIDASKLKKHELEKENKSSYYSPEINIIWKQSSRELSFIDNGTGMTLDIIQNHLLKVGSSRYQDAAFKKKFPNFSPISRFGIGILTCFLIADDLDINTKSCESDKGILLKIRKIHGKYLLKYIQKENLNNHIQEHGTEIKLYVRADVDLTNIEEDLKKWILIPNCKINLITDDKSVIIGSSSPKQLYENYLREKGYDVDGKNLKIQEVEGHGVTFVYGLKYNDIWKEWNFLDFKELDPLQIAPIGTCIEGIRVDSNSPGFSGRNLLALINTTGKNAPKTNVARSNIEKTSEKDNLLYTIYEMYLEHITNEFNNLKQDNSITWAVNEAHWLLNTFTRHQRFNMYRESRLEDPAIFIKALSKFNGILIERDTKREIICIDKLKDFEHFWTIECASYSSADSLIKEVKSSNTSVTALFNTIFGEQYSNIEHIDLLLCNIDSDKVINNIIKNIFHIDSIKLIPEQRRLDLRWSIKKDKIWEEITMYDEDYNRSPSVASCYVQLENTNLEVSYNVIISRNELIFIKGNNFHKYLLKLIDDLRDKTNDDNIVLAKIIEYVRGIVQYKNLTQSNIEEYFNSQLDRRNNRESALIYSKINKEEFFKAILSTNFKVFDTTIWSKRFEY